MLEAEISDIQGIESNILIFPPFPPGPHGGGPRRCGRPRALGRRYQAPRRAAPGPTTGGPIILIIAIVIVSMMVVANGC